MLDAQQGQDVQVLAGLRHDAVVGRHHEDAAVDPAGPGDHRLDEVLVARDIDDADLDVGDDARGKAQLDRHAAFFLDLEPVRVAAGQELDQRGLAVIDVPGGAERDVVLLSGHVSYLSHSSYRSHRTHKTYRTDRTTLPFSCRYSLAASAAATASTTIASSPSRSVRGSMRT